jgi:serine/threonine-protein kinase
MNPSFDLDPVQWARLRTLLDAALALPPDRRGGWLDTLSEPADVVLAPRLRALLAHAESTGDAALLATLPKLVETGQFGAPPPVVERAGERIGPYRLIRELGSGGMASVWLAERVDLLQQRRVALKLPHGAWKRAGLAERLAREREILATLEHPNIARLYDAGAGDGGQPWIALEFIEGEPLDRYAQRKGLDVPTRVRLVVQVARAVAHAHAQLVVHRDLKPANILVTEAGTVKLLDFGIAKLLDRGVAAETALTQQAGRALTPGYAAPEQILGKPVGTAADVYALGVVLYELLAGERPYRLKRDSRAALEEAVLAADVPRPSTLAPAERRRALRGDLDAIVLKALKRDPAERYPTTAAFVDDLERYLDHRPVAARPDGALYRAARFVRRHRVPVGVSAALLAALLAGLAGTAWQARVARAEQQRAEQALGFLVSVFREADPNVGAGGSTSAAELLRRARDRIDTAFADQPLMRVELLNALAESLSGVQDLDAADAASAHALREAEAHLGASHPQALRARTTRVAVHSARYDLAAKRTELDALLRLLGPDPAPHPRLWLQAQIDWAEQQVGERRFVEAERTARDALAQADRLGEPWHEQRSALWQAVASANEFRARYAEAIEAAQQAVRHAEAAWSGRAAHPQVMNTRYVLGRVLGLSNRHPEAIGMLERVTVDAQAHWGPQSRLYGQYLQALALTQARAGRLPAARERMRGAAAVIEKNYGPDAPHTGAVVDGMAFVHYLAREPDAGIPLYDRAQAIAARTLGPSTEPTFAQRMRRAALRAWGGELVRARDDLAAVVDEYGRVGQGSLAGPLWHLGMVERLAGRPEAALALQDRALAAVRAGPTAERERLQPRLERGAALQAMGRHAEAAAELADTLRQADALGLARTPLRCDGELALGRALLALGRAAEAVRTLAACDGYWQTLDAGSPWAGEAAFWHGRALAAAGRGAEAGEAERRARALLVRSPLPLHRALQAGAAAPRG